jgi:hypothetical protein
VTERHSAPVVVPPPQVQTIVLPPKEQPVNKGLRNMWLITQLVIIALFACCVILVYSSEIKMTAQ